MNLRQDTVQRYTRIADLTIEEVENGEYVDLARIINGIQAEVRQVIELNMVSKFDMADIHIKLNRCLDSINKKQ